MGRFGLENEAEGLPNGRPEALRRRPGRLCGGLGAPGGGGGRGTVSLQGVFAVSGRPRGGPGGPGEGYWSFRGDVSASGGGWSGWRRGSGREVAVPTSLFEGPGAFFGTSAVLADGVVQVSRATVGTSRSYRKNQCFLMIFARVRVPFCRGKSLKSPAKPGRESALCGLCFSPRESLEIAPESLSGRAREAQQV